MKRLIITTVVFCSPLVFLGCNDSFSASAPFQPRMVIYSVLTTESDTQYVRVYTTYNPPDNDPSKNVDEVFVEDAIVSMTQTGGPTFTFRPINVRRADTSRYKSSIGAFVAAPFRPLNGKKYTLNVSSASLGTATASITVPGTAEITLVNSFVLVNPMSRKGDFGLQVALAPEAKGYLARIFVDYLYPVTPNDYQPKRVEIPVSRRVISCALGIVEETYPHPTRRTTPAVLSFERKGILYKPEEGISCFTAEVYASKIGSLYDIYGPGILFKQAVIYFLQIDGPLWDAHGVANLFQDPHSVRLDQPDFTNLQNGVGVFGSVTVDSIVWPLPTAIASGASGGGCR